MTVIKTEDYLFAHWLQRKSDILSRNGGTWNVYEGDKNFNILHKLIDEEIHRLQLLRNPNINFYKLPTYINN